MRQTIRLLLVTCEGPLAAGGLEVTAAQRQQAPVPVTGPAISVTGSTATSSTGVHLPPNGNQLEYAFQYGTSTKYDKGTTPVILPAGTANEAVSAQVQGLKAVTSYPLPARDPGPGRAHGQRDVLLLPARVQRPRQDLQDEGERRQEQEQGKAHVELDQAARDERRRLGDRRLLEHLALRGHADPDQADQGRHEDHRHRFRGPVLDQGRQAGNGHDHALKAGEDCPEFARHHRTSATLTGKSMR